MTTVELQASILGEPEYRVEGADKVRGRALYAADVAMPGMLHAAFVTSPYPHARIVSVDVSAARELAGVRAVITGADTKPARFGRRLQDWPVLCWDRTLFIGDRVAAVAADTPEIADEAARLVEVEYEELPAILDVDAALAAGAPVLHPDAASYAFLGGGTRTMPERPNIQGHGVREHGDLEGAFRAAFRTYEHTFTVPRIHQAYIEPRAALVWLDGDTVRVVTTNKAPFSLRNHLAVSLGIPEERIVVDAGHIGGDFGGKGLSLDEFALYFLARATGRPVRSVMRYADDLQATNTRHAAKITLRTGVDRDGRILAHTSRVIFDGGAYAAGKPVATLMPGDALLTLAGYRVPAARVEAMTVYTNQVPAGHARAPGQPQNAFAAESHFDLIARDLGIDPLALRERNVVRPGDTDVTGQPWHGTDGPALLARLREVSRYGPSLRSPGSPPNWWGSGVALGVRHVGRGRASMLLRVLPGGRLELRTGVSDQGGGAHTLFQRIVATELGVPLDRVSVVRGTTDAVPADPGVGGSRVTPVQGSAALDAARKVKAKLAELDRTINDPEPLEVVGEAAQDVHESSMYAYVLRVRVDRETGSTTIEDATLVADVGTVINPVALRGQLEGGFVFGLGQAVMEELRVEDGRVVTANLGDYKLPTIADVPRLQIELITDHPGPGPFGAKSAGELANPAVGPAVANAVHDACGARVRSLPITAEKIWTELRRV